MSNKVTFEEILSDEGIRSKLQEAKDKEEALRILRDAGLEITEEEMKEKLNEVTGELGEEDLEGVAGGYVRPNYPRSPLPNPGPFPPRYPKFPYPDIVRWLRRIFF